MHEEKVMEEDKETSASKPSSINSLVAEIGKPESNRRRHKQLWPEMEEDGNATDDEAEQEEKTERSEVGESSSNSSHKKIIKELKNIQRQNTITHYLLAASILVTLAWQLSEFSLIFRLKQSINNPLKSLAGSIKGLLFNKKISQNNDDNQQTQVAPPTYLPGLKIPDLPDLPGFDTSSNDDDE